ncbi:hypothetical protein Glove_220g6 [Diversispora epigaea]|uniref:RING-type domain-containing protein n=1 Tax=Diversispora epigaea TaxID=1348612 RepID=A0A397IK94_9GLOM|nr:hypothetical protein Glove_220g6 [Diversispora epigaea]
MASETLLSSSEERTDTANISQLKALSLNFLQNISEISNEEEVPKLSPCHKCGKEILAFPLRAFVVLSCEHIFHRTCIEQHIVRIDTQASTHPSCPICSTIIEVIREEGTLASDKYQMVPKIRSLIVSEKKTFQQSPDTVDNDDDDDGDLEEMIKLGLIVDDSSEKTKQVIIEDHETSPIASEIISDNQNDEASTAEKGTTNVVQINSADQNNANKTAVLPSKPRDRLSKEGLYYINNHMKRSEAWLWFAVYFPPKYIRTCLLIPGYEINNRDYWKNFVFRIKNNLTTHKQIGNDPKYRDFKVQLVLYKKNRASLLIQRTYRLWKKQNNSAKIIQNAVIQCLYQPDGSFMEQAKDRYYQRAELDR